jgi:hypothetical protein
MDLIDTFDISPAERCNVLSYAPNHYGEITMSKERSSTRETKKKPAKTMSEKKAEKRAKKASKSFAGG